jgi:hypothetical protein
MKTKNKRKPSKGRSPRARAAPAEGQITPGLRQLGTNAQAAVEQDERDEYAIGEAFNALVDSGEAEAAGWKSAAAFWDAFVQGDVRSRMAALFGRLARHFSPETVAKYHPSTLDALLDYFKATETDPLNDPGPQLVSVPNAEGGFTDKPFSACTRKEIQAATKAASPRAPPRPKPAPKGPSLPADDADFIQYALEFLSTIVPSSPLNGLEGVLTGGKVAYVLTGDRVQWPLVMDRMKAATDAYQSAFPKNWPKTKT